MRQEFGDTLLNITSVVRIARHRHHLSLSFSFLGLLIWFMTTRLLIICSFPIGLVCFSWILIYFIGARFFSLINFDHQVWEFGVYLFGQVVFMLDTFNCNQKKRKGICYIQLGRIVYLVISVWLIAQNFDGYECLI